MLPPNLVYLYQHNLKINPIVKHNPNLVFGLALMARVSLLLVLRSWILLIDAKLPLLGCLVKLITCTYFFGSVSAKN